MVIEEGAAKMSKKFFRESHNNLGKEEVLATITDTIAYKLPAWAKDNAKFSVFVKGDVSTENLMMLEVTLVAKELKP
jgi:hypothetical protein